MVVLTMLWGPYVDFESLRVQKQAVSLQDLVILVGATDEVLQLSPLLKYEWAGCRSQGSEGTIQQQLRRAWPLNCL